MENNASKTGEWIAIVIIIAVVAVLGTWGITREVIHRQAIAHGAAHYTLHGSDALFAWGPGE